MPHVLAFLVPLVENWVSPEGEPVDEFLRMLEDSFSHDEVWPQPYDHLYVSLRSGRSLGKRPDVGEDVELKRLGGGQPPSFPWHARPQSHEIQDFLLKFLLIFDESEFLQRIL